MSTENNIETASEVVDAAPQDAASTALVECDRVEQGLATLEADYKGVIFDVSKGAGLEAAKKARLEIRETRFAVQNAVEAAKKYLNERKKKIDTRGDAIVARLKAIEDPIDGQIKAEEERKAREKAEREAQERAAREAILLRLDEIRCIPIDLGATASTVEIAAAIRRVNDIEVASFGEFEPAAMRAVGDALKRLGTMHLAAEVREQQEAANRAERERLEAERRAHEEKVTAERAELARQQAELKRQQDEAAAAERARKAAAEAEERAAKAEQEKRDREAREAVERAARAQREAAEAAAKREREIREQAAREVAAAQAALHAASGQMLIALNSVQAWDFEADLLPGWISDQVDQALLAAAPTTQEAVHG